MEEENQINNTFDNINSNLSDIELLIEVLEKQESINKIEDQVSLEEFANLNSHAAFALNSIYFAFLKANGINAKDHKVTSEIERIKQYMIKIRKTINPKEMEGPKRNFSVNSEAAGRIIKAQTNANSIVEKQQQEQQMEVEQQQIQSQNKEKIKDAWEDNSDNENQSNQFNNRKKKMNKGSLLPTQSHLSWKEQVEKLMK